MRDFFVRWDQVSSTVFTDDHLLHLSRALASRIRDESLRLVFLEGILCKKDIQEIYRRVCEFELDYESVSVPDAVFIRQILAFFTKRSDIEMGIDREHAALSKFFEAEDLNAESNAIFLMHAQGKFSFFPDVERQLFAAQRKIAFILGDCPNLGELKFRFGPGATTQLIKRNASPRAKLGNTHACSEDFLPVLRRFLEEMPGWLPESDIITMSATEITESVRVPVEIHRGRLAFVPKSYKTHRTITVQPGLNTMFTLGVGDYMASRLRRVGVDIRDQTRNQRLAKIGSITGALATLDLSSASDTVCEELVYHLLPIDWAILLDYGRTSVIEVEGRGFREQKFSSMGNGYTFPLETLIFYALACAVCEEDEIPFVSVYGDDIILPTVRYEALVRLLKCVGFLPNLSKSFASGPFRESCGADYLSGTDIRPLYVKGPLTGQDAFRIHNHFVRNGWLDVASIALDVIDPSLRIWGPDGYGDGHLIGGGPLKPYGRKRGWCGYSFETYTFKKRRSFECFPSDHVLPSYSTYLNGCLESDKREEKVVRLPPNPDDVVVLGASPYEYTKSGRLGVTIPGKSGYNRISVYTLRDS